MNKLAIMSCAVAAGVAGCTSVEITHEGDYNVAQMEMEDCSVNPYHIDWKVRPERVTAEGYADCWFWLFSSTDGCRYAAPGFTLHSGVSAAKDSATYHAVEDAKSDAILGCMYKVTKTSKCFGIYKETKAEVRGFPADVKGIELVKDHPVLIEKDKQIVRLNSWESLGDKARTPKIESASKKSGLFSFLGF